MNSKYLDYDDITTLHLEITSRCSLRCPACLRTHLYFGQTDLKPQDLDISIIKKAIENKKFHKIYINGNLGDFTSHKDPIPILELLKNHSEKLSIHTHGSARKPEWWLEVSKYLDRRFDTMIFSIDGLEDTNHLYRKNSNWKKLYENLVTYCNTGNRTRIDFIVFEHNQHQISEMQKLAKTLNIYQLNIKHSKRYNDEDIAENNKLSKQDEHQISKYKNFEDYVQNTNITCKTKSEKSIYIDYNGKVWPCCWMGTGDHRAWLNHATKDNFRITDIFGENWNNIKYHSIKKIMQHPFYMYYLSDTWEGKNKRFNICGKICGECYKHSTLDNSYKKKVT